MPYWKIRRGTCRGRVPPLLRERNRQSDSRYPNKKGGRKEGDMTWRQRRPYREEEEGRRDSISLFRLATVIPRGHIRQIHAQLFWQYIMTQVYQQYNLSISCTFAAESAKVSRNKCCLSLWQNMCRKKGSRKFDLARIHDALWWCKIRFTNTGRKFPRNYCCYYEDENLTCC